MVKGIFTLLGARSVPILEGVAPAVTGRFVEAASGVTIREFRPPEMPVEQLADWFALRLPEAIQANASPDRPRIALLGLRFDLDSPTNRRDERQANLLLSLELQNAGAPVLERWRMQDLVFEKSLASSDSPFWSPATLVCGSLSRTETGFALRLRLKDLEGRTRNVAVEGDSLPEVVTQAVRSIVENALEVGRSSPRLCEREVFLLEARWLLEHGLPAEALQAVEAAIALGAEGVEPDALRVRAAAMVPYPDDLRYPQSHNGGYQADAITEEELPVRVAAATEMSLLAGDFLQKHTAEKPPEWWTLEHPAVLGVHSLYTGLRVLRFANDSGWFRESPQHREAVRDLRTALRRQIELLQTIPLQRSMGTLFSYLTNYAGYWTETPLEALAFYRKVLHPDFIAGISDWPKSIRGELAFHSSVPHPPFLEAENLAEDFRYGTGSAGLGRKIVSDEARFCGTAPSCPKLTLGGFHHESGAGLHVEVGQRAHADHVRRIG